VAISPDGKTLAAGCDDKTVKIWDLTTGQERASLKGHTNVVLAVAFRPLSTTLASASVDGTARLWDLQTGELRLKLP
jgi:WD40 repeat protein